VTPSPNSKPAHEGVWRSPDVESLDLYPGLVVHDGRVSGSITIGQSRLPLWAVIHTALNGGFDRVELEYGPTGWNGEEFTHFLYNLLESRGELARLLLVLADVERQESLDDSSDLVWWDRADQRSRVRDALTAALAAIDEMPPAV
jgi:hypothetical protein